MERWKRYVLNFLGTLFLVLGVAAIANTIYRSNVDGIGLAPILWFCYICMILLGIGVLKKDSFLVLSQLNILAIPFIFWNIDFVYHVFAGESLFGIVDYFFIAGPLFEKIISAQHVFTVPLGIYVLYLIRLGRKDAWKLSFVQIAIVYFVTRLVTTFEENVNCVFENCANFDFGLPYILEWFVAMFLMIFVTNWVIKKIIINKSLAASCGSGASCCLIPKSSAR